METPSGKQAEGGFKTDAYDGEKVRSKLVYDVLPPAIAIVDYALGHGKTVG